jgi:pimeloyl-ACP methyl ester carboxylesterase
MPRRGTLLGLLAGLLLGGCATPNSRIEAFAQQHDLRRDVVTGEAFRHVLYRPAELRVGSRLDVYLEGDGSPYRNRYQVASDPTPRRPVALTLMSEDPAPALYLGRPCYFGMASQCDAAYWTQRRFSPEVVASLAAVLRAEIARADAQHVTLIGHSGGAALALLLAAQMPQIDRVITLAGVLDVAAWVQLHHYAPLAGSLDPATLPGYRPDLMIKHYAGGSDQNVPASLIEQAAHHLGGQVSAIAGFTHTCCWADAWPDLLRSFDDATTRGVF